jgi:hypothetical protein
MAVRRAAVSLAMAFLVLLRCSQLSGGAGGETTNGLVTGALRNEDGSYGSGAVVRLFPDQYDPVKDTVRIRTQTTDALGNYTFSRVEPGNYCMYAAHGLAGKRTMIARIHVEDDTCIAPLRTLQATGTIKVSLPSVSDYATGYLYIPGTGHYVFLTGRTDFVLLDSVPAGVVPNVSYSSTLGDYSAVIRYSISVASADTAVVWNPSWRYARTLSLNTAASGADVPGNVGNFPVLIRLRDSVFDFSQARPDGADIRFAKKDTTLLPFEIERWDPVHGTAAMWVLFDSVRGGDGDQSFFMFWGNPNVQNASNGAAVFKASNGFIGVWHLDTLLTDATGNLHDGRNCGAADATGIIGAAKRFDGQDSITVAGLLGEPASVTLSGWVKTDTTIASGQEIVSIGDAALIRADETVNGYGTGGYAHRYTVKGDTSFTKVTSGLNIAKTGWRFVAFTFDNVNQAHTLYIDGAALRVDTSPYAIDYSGVGNNTFIGAHANNKTSYNSRGVIDEVRVCGVARSADWIKLCYMNQRNDDRLVRLK